MTSTTPLRSIVTDNGLPSYGAASFVNEDDKNDVLSRGLWWCFMGCAMVLGLCAFAFLGTTFYFAYTEQNATCQVGARAGISLSLWLKVVAWMDVSAILSSMMLLCLAQRITPTQDEAEELYVVVQRVISVLLLLFFFAWSVVGIVVLATKEANSCVAEGTGSAIVAILHIAGLVFRCQYVSAKNK